MYLAPEGITGPGYVSRAAGEVVLDDLDRVYGFVFARVGNRPDAEDIVQQVALKALPRLRAGASVHEVRAYLYATARSVLATFWSARYRIPESELTDDMVDDRRGPAPEPSAEAAGWLEETLARLPANYRRVLELRFLRGYSSREVAREIGSTEGAVKVMQLRALRAAAAQPSLPSRSRPGRPLRAAVRGSASAPLRATPASAAPPR